ncbi:MAG: lysylphosphatidylglycerol synthase domain-containing protein [bacterium]
MLKFIRKILPVLIIILIFIFLAKNLLVNWGNIPFQNLHFNVFFIGVSFLALIIHFLSYSRSWQEVMRILGSNISFVQSTWMIATTQIAKYLPGRVWYMVGRVYVGKNEKLKGESLAISMVLETCLLLVTSSIIFLICTVLTGNYKINNIIIAAVLVIIAVIIMHPTILTWMSNLALRILKRPRIKISVRYIQILKMSIYFFGLWIAQIAGFYFLINAIYQVPISDIFVLASAHTLSWIIGFIVLFAPSGLGVREGVLTLMLSTIMPTPLAIAISFVSRVWITVFEVVVFFIGLLIRRKEKEDNAG